MNPESATGSLSSVRTVVPSGPIVGTVFVPGDKSITHRAFLFATCNAGSTQVVNPSPAEDVQRSLELARALGYQIAEDHGRIEIRPGAVHRHDSSLMLDCGNSGTTARLAAGRLARVAGLAVIDGDASLRSRPMERIAEPLRRMGATIESTGGGLPLRIHGHELPGTPEPFDVTSAQVFTALVLAGLGAERGVTLRSAAPMRDHTLRMLPTFGLRWIEQGEGVLHVPRQTPSRETTVRVPGDFSSSAFIIAAAVLVPGSDVVIGNVGINPTRIAFLGALRAMGASVTIDPLPSDQSEPVGVVTVRYRRGIRGIDLDEHGEISVALMMDELPLLALVATQAHGRTVVRGAAELRLKESDRIAHTAAVLRALGGRITELEDGFEIEGPQRLRPVATVDPAGDHRLAMMATIGGLVAEGPVTIANPECTAVSWPGFWEQLSVLAPGCVGMD